MTTIPQDALTMIRARTVTVVHLPTFLPAAALAPFPAAVLPVVEVKLVVPAVVAVPPEEDN